jgi:uncharacterized membrane protein
MGIIVALAIGLMIWVAAWSFGVHAFDGIMLVIAILVVAFTVHLLAPFVRRQLGRE